MPWERDVNMTPQLVRAESQPSPRARASILSKVPGVLYAFIFFIAVFGVRARGFLSLANLVNVSLQGSILAIVSLGMTLVIMTGGIDLSIGSVLSLAGAVTGLLLHGGSPVPLAILAGLLTGMVCGAINGFLISRLNFFPFISTFGMMGIAQGIALVLTDGASLPGFSPAFRAIGDSVVIGIPLPVWIAGAVFGVIYFFLYKTTFGARVYAVGGSKQVARLSGIPVSRVLLSVYTISGFLAGLGGVVLISRMNSANPTVGAGYEFDAIAAVVIGGTPFSGGRGGIGGSILGAAVISVLKNGLNLMGLSAPWQLTVIGLMITAAIVVDVMIYNRKS
ncbi:MAG TPA: ABC transporter permease [Firmicutes bacterium]|nr:ABC transporter permease [Bacillota bacterium]